MLSLQHVRSLSISGSINGPRHGGGSSSFSGPSSRPRNNSDISSFSRSTSVPTNELDFSTAELNRIGTGFSSASTISPAVTTEDSSITSAESQGSIRWVKSERLQSAVQSGNLESIASIIDSGGREVSQSYARCLAPSFEKCLYLYRRTRIRLLLFSMHAAIGRLRSCIISSAWLLLPQFIARAAGV